MNLLDTLAQCQTDVDETYDRLLEAKISIESMMRTLNHLEQQLSKTINELERDDNVRRINEASRQH